MDPTASSPHSYLPVTHTSQVSVLPEVATLSKEDLEDLLACEDKLTEFVTGLPPLAALKNQCDQLVIQNENLAKATLERSNDYERARDATIQKVEELTALRGSFEDMTIDQQKASEKLSPTSVQESLLIYAVQSEEESEKIADDFLQKQIDVDAFLGKYMEKRIIDHDIRTRAVGDYCTIACKNIAAHFIMFHFLIQVKDNLFDNTWSTRQYCGNALKKI